MFLFETTVATQMDNMHLFSNFYIPFIPTPRHSLSTMFWTTTLDTGSGPSITQMRPADLRQRPRAPCTTV